MKGSVRYILTRPCLSEGSVRLLKYLESVFPHDGTVTLIDDRGHEHAARADRRAGRVDGLRDLYTGHNLGVNDVLLITVLAEHRYQVECIVKPAQDRAASAARPRAQDVPTRVVVNQSPYVREVRLERRAAPTEPRAPESRPSESRAPEPRTPDVSAPARPTESRPAEGPTPSVARATPARETPTPQHATSTPDGASTRRETTLGAAPVRAATTAPVALSTSARPLAPTLAVAPVSAARAHRVDAPPAAPALTGVESMLRELAGLVGYRVEVRGEGVLRLRADLGPQSYSVLVALDLGVTSSPAWREDADYLAVLVSEHERPPGLPRLTHEALAALLDNARLASITPLELRGYWNAGSFDLESVQSVAELVSAQLSQRGVFSFVLLTLAQQPAHSVVSAARLSERLGSGVNGAELARVLDLLTGAPFSALSPLGSGLYYLRIDVSDLLCSLGEYAEGLRVRMGAERGAALVR